MGGTPMTERHLVPKYIRCDHSREVHRVLCTAKLRCVTKLDFLKVVYRGVHLDQSREGIYSAHHPILTKGLGSEQKPVGLPEDRLP
jgi:hypothetical protein